MGNGASQPPEWGQPSRRHPAKGQQDVGRDNTDPHRRRRIRHLRLLCRQAPGRRSVWRHAPPIRRGHAETARPRDQRRLHSPAAILVAIVLGHAQLVLKLVPQQRQQDDDGDRDSQQPKQNAATHLNLHLAGGTYGKITPRNRSGSVRLRIHRIALTQTTCGRRAPARRPPVAAVPVTYFGKALSTCSRARRNSRRRRAHRTDRPMAAHRPRNAAPGQAARA